MARPKGSKNKSTIRKGVQKMKESSLREDDEFTDLSVSEILGMCHERFDVMSRMGMGCLNGSVRGLIISGAPGIGKTHTIEKMLKNRKEEREEKFRYKIIKGNVSAIGLYKTMSDYSNKGEVILLDDVDSIFYDEIGIALLKAGLDSGDERWLTWMSESHALKEREGGSVVKEYPTTFKYDGTMIFITNTDFQHLVEKGTKLAPHYAALMSRSIYLDLKVHTIRTIAIWVQYIVNKHNILVNKYDLSKDQQKQALAYISDNMDRLRTISIRDAMKIGQMMQTDPDYWEEIANVTLLKEVVYNGRTIKGV